MRIFLLLSLLVVPAPSFSAPPVKEKPKLPEPAKGKVDFVKDIQPLFVANCVQCHNPDKRKGGLSLANATSAMEGGNSGKVIVPGKSAESRLILAVAALDPDAVMPPEGKKLTFVEIAKLRAWIDQGATWPKDVVISGSAKKSAHWAFQPITSPVIPKVKNAAWVRNGIDAFILAKLEKEGVSPAAEADRVTLIRRLYLDLLGLPPTPEAVDAFAKDARPDAYEHLVKQVLESPHYGERWGRHWLDAARYADSDGYEKDTGRPWAWRYREWVIQAMNRDLPFDRFTIEQMAGDLLPNATADQKIATGFHRNTLTNKEGGVDQEQFRVEAVIDRVNTTGKVFLGITIGCAQCHDHKYDPFSMRDYYQFFAFFNSDREVDIDAPITEEATAMQERKVTHAKRRQELMNSLTAYQKIVPEQMEKWEKALKPEEIAKLPAPVMAALKVEATKRTDAEKATIRTQFEKTDTKLAQLNKAIADHDKTPPATTKAPTLAYGPERKTHVHIRGDFLRKGVEVGPGTPGSLSKLTSAKPNRLDLAKWLVDASNPLTRRVIANWIWQKYFGRGLVATLEDFGTQGEKPTHPELFDWLANQLSETGWSLKTFHRLVVTSATYRQSSKDRRELKDRDPMNLWLARQVRTRLEAEILRDNALSACGLLTTKIGGPSVRPPQPPGISELTYANSAKWVESIGPDRYRRGMYIWFQRTSPYPMLMTFDSPDSNICVVRREKSNTPLQALTLMNDVVFVECAQEMGRKLATQKGSEEERITGIFRTCVSRTPTPAEEARLVKLLHDFRELAKANPDSAVKLVGKKNPTDIEVTEVAAWVAFSRTLLNLDEFVTRE